MSRRRLEASDLVVPFRGARLPAASAPTFRDLAAAYETRMPPEQFFSHVTAARLNGVPLPIHLTSDERLHVSVLAPNSRPRSTGVIGHVLSAGRVQLVESNAGCMTGPATTWCQLAPVLTLENLVAAGDFLLTGDPSRRHRTAYASVQQLAYAARAHRGARGMKLVRVALPLVRRGPLSRPESLVRVRLVLAGLPEPVIAFTIRDVDGRHLATVDLAYPDLKIALEYEGDYHREQMKFRLDINRYERLADLGWLVVRISAHDVPPSPDAHAARALVERIRARIASRG